MEAEVIEFDFDAKAQSIGLHVGVPNEIYTWTVSRNSALYVEYYKSRWIAWRETYEPGRAECKNYKIIAQGNFNLVLARVKKYMKYVNRGWNR